MLEGVLPVTRLSIAEALFGCWMWTAEPWPIEKLCQLTTALWLDWVMFSCVDVGAAIDTLPAATLPPVGRFCACAEPSRRELVSVVVASSSALRGLMRRRLQNVRFWEKAGARCIRLCSDASFHIRQSREVPPPVRPKPAPDFRQRHGTAFYVPADW